MNGDAVYRRPRCHTLYCIIIVLLGVVAACIDSFNCYNNLMLVSLELILSGIYIYMSPSLKFSGNYVLHTYSQTWTCKWIVC